MNIEWWMIDGLVCLIMLAAALRGAVRGISDTILRLLGLIGGGVLAVMFSDRLSAYLTKTKINSSLHDHFFVILRGNEAAQSGEAVIDSGGNLVSPDAQAQNGFLDMISKSVRSMFSTAADQAADAAASRLTEVAIGVIAFALILLGVSLAVSLIRAAIKHGRRNSIILGFTDRTLGMVLGFVRGLLLAWVAVALLIPVTTLVSPGSVQGMMTAMQQTTISRVLYDVNPLLLLLKYLRLV